MSLRRIFLHGPLAEKYGSDPFEFNADNISDLLGGLRIHCPGIRQELMKYSTMTIIKVLPGGELESISPDELAYGFGLAKDLHINTNLTAAGAETFALAMASYGSFAYYAAYAIYTLAIMYVMSQVMQGLQDTIVTEDAKADNKSALFDGPENRVRQGARVQLNYGRCRIGSVTLNQALTAVRQSIIKEDNIAIIPGTTGTYNIYSNDLFTVSPVVSSFTINGTTTAAGGTYTSAGAYTVNITAAGLVTVTSIAGDASFTISVSATDTGTSQVLDQSVNVTITTPQDTWVDAGGPGGGDGGDGGGGGGGGGDAAGPM